jgi:hypothetical protein
MNYGTVIICMVVVPAPLLPDSINSEEKVFNSKSGEMLVKNC